MRHKEEGKIGNGSNRNIDENVMYVLSAYYVPATVTSVYLDNITYSLQQPNGVDTPCCYSPFVRRKHRFLGRLYGSGNLTAKHLLFRYSCC